MKIETLVVTTDRYDTHLAEEMNLQTDAVIGNQCAESFDRRTVHNGSSVLWLSRRERGVGENRNLVLEHAAGDICVLADDDLQFVDGYPAIVQRAFEEAPDADVIVFNLLEEVPVRFVNKSVRRIRWYNYARYGAARLAIRRKSILDAGIRFTTLFGGGAVYGSGEDTIFLHQCLTCGLKIVAVPYAIARMDPHVSSSWFCGYNKKFFHDKGALYACLYPRAALLFCTRYLIKYRRKYNEQVTMRQAFGWMCDGVRAYRKQDGEKTEEAGCGSV